MNRRAVQIIILGDSSVGKTSMMNRFMENKFDEDVGTSIGISYTTKKF